MKNNVYIFVKILRKKGKLYHKHSHANLFVYFHIIFFFLDIIESYKCV